MKLSEQLFFAKEAADYLGISTQRLNKLVNEGKLIPLKKNASGTLFHIDELNRRRQELRQFSEVVYGDGGMFELDTKIKKEALAFATMLNVLGVTENTLNPLFDGMPKECPIDAELDDITIATQYANYYKCDVLKIIDEYRNAKRAFLALKKNDEIIKKGSVEYPPLLENIDQAPRFLYIRGNKALLYEKRTVALVGSRQAGEKAKEYTRRLAVKLGSNGIIVISGLAKGIDVSAHVAALENGYNTIAVIGTCLNQYYPPENKSVQLQIEEKGLIVSQFSPASKTQRWFFPSRNRVMSGLSLATVVMEATETSGALKQASFALSQGRQVIIPQNVFDNKAITWPNRFLTLGAKKVSGPNEVLKVLAENNIFKCSDGSELLQRTIEDYLKQVQQKKMDSVDKVELMDPF